MEDHEQAHHVHRGGQMMILTSMMAPRTVAREAKSEPHQRVAGSEHVSLGLGGPARKRSKLSTSGKASRRGSRLAMSLSALVPFPRLLELALSAAGAAPLVRICPGLGSCPLGALPRGALGAARVAISGMGSWDVGEQQCCVSKSRWCESTGQGCVGDPAGSHCRYLPTPYTSPGVDRAAPSWP